MNGTWGRNPGIWGKRLILRPEYTGVHSPKIFGRSIVTPPDIFTFFDEHYEQFFFFINNLEEVSANNKVLIDISRIQEVKAAALLVLYSTIEIIQKKTHDIHRIKLTACNRRFVSKSFWKNGFWKLTSQDQYLPQYRKSHKGLEICTASLEATLAGDDSQLRRVIDYSQEMVLEAGFDEEADLLAYNAITESVSNVWQHAYDATFVKGGVIDKQLAHWWIVVERIKNQFFIAVYDRGAGIPYTLEQKPWYKVAFIDAKGDVHNVPIDALSIKIAVGYGESRFKSDGRGKGLTEAKDFVRSNPMGTMIIYSGHGDYTYHSATGKEELKDLPSRFNGTLIQWNLSLEPKK